VAFRDWVSGYRPRRNRITALSQVMAHMAAGRTIVADIDVAPRIGRVRRPGGDRVAGGLRQRRTFLALFRTVLSGPPEPIAPGTGLAPLLINLRLSRVPRCPSTRSSSTWQKRSWQRPARQPPRNEEADGLRYSRFQIDAMAARSHARAAITAAARANAAVANDRDARGQATVRMAGLASVTGR
jgi:hypothetical protein